MERDRCILLTRPASWLPGTYQPPRGDGACTLIALWRETVAGRIYWARGGRAGSRLPAAGGRRAPRGPQREGLGRISRVQI